VLLLGVFAAGALSMRPDTVAHMRSEPAGSKGAHRAATFDPQLVGPDPEARAFADAAGAKGRGRPNIVLVTTDDMTLSDLRFMPVARRLLGAEGVTFDRFLSPDPLCCPARAAILTGQWGHNNGVKSNQAPYDYAALQAGTALPVWLHRAGYRTAFTGKYLNGFGTRGPRQPGWDYWDATMAGQYSYQPFAMANNKKKPTRYDDINNVDYINFRVNRLIDQWAPKAKPFFIWASQLAPHNRILNGKSRPTALPAHRYRHAFRGKRSPSLRDPAYDEFDLNDKNVYVRGAPMVTSRKVNQIFRSRIRSLQAVDDGIAQLVSRLKAHHVLDNTYIVFTSDNGFLMGEHRLIEKNLPYAQSIGVPLLIRGPDVPRGEHRDQLATMVDLAPTFAEVANAQPLVQTDGQSLLPVLERDLPLRETVLIQAGPAKQAASADGWFWRGVTTGRYTYARYYADGFEELFDHDYDRAEVASVVADPAYAAVLAELRRRTEVLGACAGAAECSATFPALPTPGS